MITKQRNKRIVIVLLALLFISFYTISSKAAEKTYQNFTYTVDGNNNVVITGYIGTKKEITIPSTISGKTVVRIGNKAFQDSKITKVTFPSTLKSIGTSAFQGSAITGNLSLPSNLEVIGASAFRDCKKITFIDGHQCTKLKEIKPYAFYDCIHVGYISFTNFDRDYMLTTIGSKAFCYIGYARSNEVDNDGACSTIAFPNSVKSIAKNAFYKATKTRLSANYNTYVHNYAIENNLPYFITGDTYDLANCKIVFEDSNSNKIAYTGKAIKPKVKIYNGKTLLKEGFDYNLEYENNTKVGICTIKALQIIGKEYCDGVLRYKYGYNGKLLTKTFTIIPKTNNITKITTKNKTIIINWAKATTTNLYKYQIQYSTNSSFTNTKTINGTTALNYTIKNLTKGKKYYVRIRSVSMVKDTMIYGNWSTTKNIVVK